MMETPILKIWFLTLGRDDKKQWRSQGWKTGWAKIRTFLLTRALRIRENIHFVNAFGGYGISMWQFPFIQCHL